MLLLSQISKILLTEVISGKATTGTSIQADKLWINAPAIIYVVRRPG